MHLTQYQLSKSKNDSFYIAYYGTATLESFFCESKLQPQKPMTIRKFILFILTLSIYGLLLENSFADNRKHCIPKITSSSAREINGQPHKMIISGPCLEKVTHVTLAKDDGDGFESLEFTKESNPKLKTDLAFVIPKRAEGKANFTQPPRYLLQIHVCKDKVITENCKTHEPTIFINYSIQ